MGLRTYEEEKRSDKIDDVLDAVDRLSPLLRRCRTDEQLMDTARSTSVLTKDGQCSMLAFEVTRLEEARRAMSSLVDLLESLDADLREANYVIRQRVSREIEKPADPC